ncbi:hypothetical protein ACHAWC_004978 [Mediolabrus comicus]
MLPKNNSSLLDNKSNHHHHCPLWNALTLILTYRFANEPIVEEDEQKQVDEELRRQRKVYSGKVKLKFNSDGYTTNLSSSSQKQQQTGDITFQKVWGWDIETSDQDSYNYILFSADIITGTESERFYFQARVDDDRQTGALQLNDGSVTVKRDIKLPGAGGFWGVFGGADKILAQFRQVGEFKCKPIAGLGFRHERRPTM